MPCSQSWMFEAFMRVRHRIVLSLSDIRESRLFLHLGVCSRALMLAGFKLIGRYIAFNHTLIKTRLFKNTLFTLLLAFLYLSIFYYVTDISKACLD
ncbi:uncharacterized protein F5Z01DRAFT_270065 [Emericellopsis atlantica]|uniref:Uncharacterized protein n=1 Tax=Emericellopsis atlantica TaxID=2614577 RepID=A0A9P7ZGB2_9HYPO|nr:uncharacterized protein F5Z01DRAFT_270065 [Emericellopsis atlantica]KAG9251574.1 hypothetical protein F5Z01DRAFT_270065 [Emericellopsis atlantica]